MKKIYFTIAAMMLVLATPQKAKAVDVSTIKDYVFGKVQEKLKGKMSLTELQRLACQQAAFPLKYSFRSRKGDACKKKHVALFVTIFCKGYKKIEAFKGFEGSGCDKEASKIYPNTTDIPSAVKSLIKEDVKVFGKIMCGLGGTSEHVGELVSSACAKVGLS